MNCISRIASIEEADSNLVAKAITSLETYLGPRPNHFSVAKYDLYIAKTIANLPITCNKSKMTQKSNFANKSPRASYLLSCTKWPTILILGRLSKLR